MMKTLFLQPPSFDGFDGAAYIILIASGARENQRVENNILFAYAELFGQKFV